VLPDNQPETVLPAGALAVLPDTRHLITPAAVRATIAFFEHLDH
jgi:hypothetical protein